VTKLDRSEIVGMLSRAAEKHGLDLRRFFELDRADELDDPNLRDLWLIWGDVLSENDVRRSA
jgi:hypothetical protein